MASSKLIFSFIFICSVVSYSPALEQELRLVNEKIENLLQIDMMLVNQR